MPRDSLVGSSGRPLHLGEYPARAPANPHRIGRPACLENHRPKDGIYTTGERFFPLPTSHFVLRWYKCVGGQIRVHSSAGREG